MTTPHAPNGVVGANLGPVQQERIEPSPQTRFRVRRPPQSNSGPSGGRQYFSSPSHIRPGPRFTALNGTTDFPGGLTISRVRYRRQRLLIMIASRTAPPFFMQRVINAGKLPASTSTASAGAVGDLLRLEIAPGGQRPPPASRMAVSLLRLPTRKVHFRDRRDC